MTVLFSLSSAAISVFIMLAALAAFGISQAAALHGMALVLFSMALIAALLVSAALIQACLASQKTIAILKGDDDLAELPKGKSLLAQLVQAAGQATHNQNNSKQLETASLTQFEKICSDVAKGNFESRIILTGESNPMRVRLGNALNNVIDYCDAYIRESVAMFEHAAQEKFYRKIIETGFTGSFRRGARVLNMSLDKVRENIASRMHNVADEMQKEIGAIADTVSAASVELRASAESLAKTSGSTKEKSSLVAVASEEVSANINTVSEASGQLLAGVNEIASKASETANLAQDAVHRVEASQTVMKTLADASREIDSVIKLIQDIAWQTNLLALNATIEAARAGDAGRGFAVVAQEVKTLADQTSRATIEISEKITAMQNNTLQASSSLNEVSDIIQNINTATVTVAASVEEQTAATNEISRSLGEATKGTQQVASNIIGVNTNAEESNHSANEVLTAADELSRRSIDLQTSVGRFVEAIRNA